MKFVKAVCVFVVALAVCACCVCGCEQRKTLNETKVETGTCGEDSSWTLTGDVLKVEGTGSVDTPIRPEGKARTIIVGDGITSIGDEIFKGIEEALFIQLPDSLYSIGSEAFSGLVGVKEITIPDSVKDIAGDAFRGWEDDQQIISEWYKGSVEDWQPYFDLWTSVFGQIRAFLNDENLREKLQSFINEWTYYIGDNSEEIVEAVQSFYDVSEEEVLGVLGVLTQFDDEFVNDILALIPEINRILDEIENEGKGIIYEFNGQIGTGLNDFYFGFGDAQEFVLGQDEDFLKAIEEALPQYERGLSALFGSIFGGGEETEDPSGEKQETGEEDSWIEFWGGIDPDVLEIILGAAASR